MNMDRREIQNFSHKHIRSEIVDFNHKHSKQEIKDFKHTHNVTEVENLNDEKIIKYRSLLPHPIGMFYNCGEIRKLNSGYYWLDVVSRKSFDYIDTSIDLTKARYVKIIKLSPNIVIIIFDQNCNEIGKTVIRDKYDEHMVDDELNLHDQKYIPYLIPSIKSELNLDPNYWEDPQPTNVSEALNRIAEAIHKIGGFKI